MRLGITVCTRSRPQMVQACVASICREIVDADLDAFVVVIENDISKSLTDAFDRLLLQFPSVEFLYENESAIGIPFARNRAVGIALENNADWLAFVDDDEELETGWLHAMFRAVHDLEADALTGPVRAHCPSNAPSWWKKQRPDLRLHGQTLESAATNNTLIHCDWLRSANPPLRFDEGLRFTGGEDTEFFHRLTDRGGTIKWVSDAIVRETVSEVRTTMSWHVIRKTRTQSNAARNYKARKGTAAAIRKFLPGILSRLLIMLPLLTAGLSCRPFSKFYSERLMLSGLKSGAAAIGAIRGLVGWQLAPYREIEGY